MTMVCERSTSGGGSMIGQSSRASPLRVAAADRDILRRGRALESFLRALIAKGDEETEGPGSEGGGDGGARPLTQPLSRSKRESKSRHRPLPARGPPARRLLAHSPALRAPETDLVSAHGLLLCVALLKEHTGRARLREKERRKKWGERERELSFFSTSTSTLRVSESLCPRSFFLFLAPSLRQGPRGLLRAPLSSFELGLCRSSCIFCRQQGVE